MFKHLFLSLIVAATALAYTDDDVVAATLILEAGGECSVGSLEAVHEVILNRASVRSLLPFEVCLQRLQFSCWNGVSVAAGVAKAKNHPRWEEALRITVSGRNHNYTNGADHYHADYVRPYWADHLEKTVQIGRHIFYK